jgi:hypothetical protein
MKGAAKGEKQEMRGPQHLEEVISDVLRLQKA